MNKVALNWDLTGTTFLGSANIHEVVTVDGTGNHYSGKFTLTRYDTNGNTIIRILGVIAERVTAD